MFDEQPLPTSTILLIEADTSLRRLIALGLQHSGMHVVEIASLKDLSPTATQSFDLLVLDVDYGLQSDWSLLEKIQSNPHFAPLPMVVLAWDHPLLDSTSSMVARSSSASTVSLLVPSCSQVVLLDKPFDARALYHVIQQLLAAHAAQKVTMEALAEARVLATYSEHVAPSIWPVVTAAGLLLVVSGLLFHIALAIVGILIVVVALLLWTLGTKSEAAPIVVGVGSQ